MRMCVGICSYGNAKGLDNTLSSLSAIADRIIVVNVPFLGFDPLPSHIGLYEKELITKYPNTLLLSPKEPMTQIEARNLYMKESKGFDFLLVMDDDEIVRRWNTSDTSNSMKSVLWNIAIKHETNPIIYNVWYEPMQDDGIPFELPGRLFYLPYRIRYTGNHYNFIVDDIEFIGRSSKYSVSGLSLTLKHMNVEKAGRTKEFEKNMERYEIWQTLGGEKHGDKYG